MTSFNLKLIAIITMLIDHIGVFLIDYSTNPFLWYLFRSIGRLAFPIFVFLIIQGHIHTKNKSKYFSRLIIFALILDIPRILFNINYEPNVFYTLAAIEMTLQMMDRSCNKVIQLLWISFISILVYKIGADYGAYGVWLGAGLYQITILNTQSKVMQIIKENILYIILTTLFIIYGGSSYIQMFGILFIYIINEYNGKKGYDNKYVQYGFYLFYPVHIIILQIISNYI